MTEEQKKKIAERQKRYREVNKEKYQEYSKKYYEANKTRILERSKQYNKSNKEKIKQYLETNKNKIAERSKKYREANKENGAARTRKRKYGLSEEQYEALIRKQNNQCAICKIHMNEKGHTKQSRCIDHCHKTGRVRALLCHRCNTMIGYAEDHPGLLKAAIKYLEFHSKAQPEVEQLSLFGASDVKTSSE